jgi:hypothetical protein
MEPPPWVGRFGVKGGKMTSSNSRIRANRRVFFSRSDARIVAGDDGDLIRLWREKRGKVEPKDLSGNLIVRFGAVAEDPNRPWCELNTSHVVTEVQRRDQPPKSTTHVGRPMAVAYTEFLDGLARCPPRPILIEADSIDLQDRADHLSAVFGGLTAYLAVVLDDTAQNAPGGLDLTDAEAILADLASDLTGAILNAADEMAGRVE